MMKVYTYKEIMEMMQNDEYGLMQYTERLGREYKKIYRGDMEKVRRLNREYKLQKKKVETIRKEIKRYKNEFKELIERLQMLLNI